MERTRLIDPAIEAAWRTLQDGGCVSSPFLSWEWASALRDVPALTRRVSVLVCRAGSEVVGLWPVEMDRMRRLRVLGVAGWNWAGPDHSDVVAAADDKPAVSRALLRAVARMRGWELLNLDWLHGSSALPEAADEVFALPRFVARPTSRMAIQFVDLGQQILSSHGRKQVRKEVRRAEATGGGFATITDPAEFPPLLDELMDLHVARFGDTSTVFATPERREFHRIAAQRLGTAGLVRMHQLRIGDESAAITYTLVWGKTVLFYAGGLRTDIGMTPGFSVRAAAMMSAADDGFSEVDLMRGEHGYKERFTTVARDDLRKRVARVGPRAAIGAASLAGDLLERRRAGREHAATARAK